MSTWTLANSPNSLTPGIYSIEMKTYLHQYLFMNIYTCFIFNNSKLETTQMSVKQWTDKLEYAYSRMCSVQSLTWAWFFVTPWARECQAPLSSTVFQSLLKFMFIELVMLSNHLILGCTLLFWPSIFSQQNSGILSSN